MRKYFQLCFVPGGDGGDSVDDHLRVEDDGGDDGGGEGELFGLEVAVVVYDVCGSSEHSSYWRYFHPLDYLCCCCLPNFDFDLVVDFDHLLQGGDQQKRPPIQHCDDDGDGGDFEE